MTFKANLTGSGIAPLAASKIVGTVTTGLTATGSTSQANSLLVTDDINNITAGGANTGVRLPSTLTAGDMIVVCNNKAQTLFVYPPVGGILNGGSTDAKVDVPTLKSAICICLNNLDFSVIWGA